MSVLSSAQMKYLNKLSEISGISQERLAYEIVLNPYYRLPVPTPAPIVDAHSSSSSGGGAISQSTLSNKFSLPDTAYVAQTLRTQLLRLMADKLVNSIRVSNISSLSEVVYVDLD